MFDVMATSLPEDVKPSPSPKARLVLDNHNQDIHAYLDWKATDVAAVKSNDYLVSLLEVLADKMGYNLDRTVQDVFQRTFHLTAEISSSLGLFSASTVGRMQNYLGQPTMFCAGISPFRAGVTASTHYKDITAVRYLSHDSDNVSMGDLPEVRGDGLEFNIVEVDYGLLYLQFVLWWKGNPNAKSVHRNGITTFVAMHVIPALKRTQYAIAFMNKIRRMADGLPSDSRWIPTSRAFNQREAGVAGMMQELANVFLRRECTFEYLLGTLPVPIVKTLGVAQTMPDVPMTRQMGWIFVLSRYNLFQYLFVLARVDPDRAARFPGINSIIRSVTRMHNDNSFSQGLTASQQASVKTKFDLLLQHTGRW